MCSQQKWISHFKSNRGKITEINTIQDRKTTLSCTFLIRLHFRMLMLGDNEMVYSVPARHAIISCNVFWQTSRGNLLHSLLSLVSGLRLQGYCCKSGNAIFAWRVTWNYTFSLFKNKYEIVFNYRLFLKEAKASFLFSSKASKL